MINFKNKNERTQDHGSRGWAEGHYKGEDKDGFYRDIRIHAEQRDDERFVDTEVRNGIQDYYASHMGHTADNLLLYAGDSELRLEAGDSEPLLEPGEHIDLLEAGHTTPDTPNTPDRDEAYLTGQYDNSKIGKFIISGMHYGVADEPKYGIESKSEIKRRKVRDAELDADYDEDDDSNERDPLMRITNRL